MKNIALRGMTNTLEQMGPFLVSLWLHAIFVNPRTSWILGVIYVVSRALYTPFYGMYGQFTILVEIATMPNYIVIFWYLLAVVVKITSGNDLHTSIDAVHPALLFLGALAAAILQMINMIGLGKPIVAIIASGVHWEKDIDPE